MKTEQLICETLIQMMEKTPFEQIRVAALCRQADISRSTFYSYYQDVYDVMQSIEDDFIEHLADERDVKLDPNDALVRSNIGYIAEHIHTFEVLTGANGDSGFAARIGNRSRRILNNIASEADSSLSLTQLQMLNEFQKAGKIRLFQWWAENKDNISTNEFIEMLDRIGNAMHNIVKNS